MEGEGAGVGGGSMVGIRIKEWQGISLSVVLPLCPIAFTFVSSLSKHVPILSKRGRE